MFRTAAFFTDADVRTAARVLVIGQTIADNLFPGMDPVGQTLRVKDLPFRVVGVMVRKGQDAQGRDQDDTALAPYSSVQKKILGSERVSDCLRLRDFAGCHVHRAGTDNRTAAPASQPWAKRTERLYRAQHDGHRRGGQRNQQHHDDVAREHCQRFVAGGRHRHHEHHAGVGY